MVPFRMLVAAVVSWCSLAASALTLEPLPGSTPQSAHLGAFFAHDVGVIVRDGWGQPVAGVPVSFVPDGLVAAPWAGYLNAFPSTVESDRDGIAIIPFVWAMNDGTGRLFAHVAGAADATFDFTVTGGLTWSLRYVSGAGQAAPVDTVLPFRWAVQALDENHRPIPYACVEFWDTEPSGAGGEFGDLTGYLSVGAPSFPIVVARADENGVATAPVWTTNENQGLHRALAAACRGRTNHQDYVTRALFEYTVTPPESVH